MNKKKMTSQVEVSVSCCNLRQRDLLSKCDPVCILFDREHASEDWIQLDQTEILRSTSNPTFSHKFILNYYFEKTQYLRFDVYDGIRQNENLLGRFEILLAILIRRKRYEGKMMSCNYKNSTIHFMSMEIDDYKESITLQFEGTNLDKKDTFGKSDPYLLIYRSEEDNVTVQSAMQCKEWTLVYQTEVIKNNLNPQWKAFRRLLPQIFGKDKKKVLKFECYDWDQVGKHDLIGIFYATLVQLKNAFEDSEKNCFPLIHPKKTIKKNTAYINSGTIMIKKFVLKQEYSFIDYIQEGVCQLSFVVAIDFSMTSTAQVETHFIECEDANFSGNQLEVAIKMINKILELYNFDDRAIMGYGFGAQMPSLLSTNEDFPLRLAGGEFLEGCNGLFAAYQNTLSMIKPCNSTRFAPIIKRISEDIRDCAKGDKYFVLFILTNGSIDDMEETKKNLRAASCLPLSVVIIGLGDGDFSSMKILDGDENIDDRTSKDIVQFVPLRDFVSENKISIKSQIALAHEALEELPRQLCQWMSNHSIVPTQWKVETIDLKPPAKEEKDSTIPNLTPSSTTPRIPPRPLNYTASK